MHELYYLVRGDLWLRKLDKTEVRKRVDRVVRAPDAAFAREAAQRATCAEAGIPVEESVWERTTGPTVELAPPDRILAAQGAPTLFGGEL